MTAKRSNPPPATVADLLQRRLKELKRSPTELAAAAQVPEPYILDLLAGRRQPPLPGRTDLYDRMTRFLRLARNQLANCASAERATTAAADARGPRAPVARALLALCEPATAQELERRRAKDGNAELADLTQRLLDISQGAVRRVLEDPVGLRIAASQQRKTYEAMRLKVLEFLDVTPATLTAGDLAEFIQPRVALWDVDLQSGVLRVVLQGQEPRGRNRRSANTRSAFPTH
ncbi:MAG: hypothetical protein OER21_01260 [Gemmatimonadota bacterium]|nr:hypothetical protein [Gemmatimonadota bacterium]